MTLAQCRRPFIFIFALAVFTVLLAYLPQNKALACKDCPFPMRVSDGRFLMPNGAVYLEVEEVSLPGPGRMVEITVILRDASTGNILAEGSTKQRRNRRTAVLTLTDSLCMPIQAQIYWQDPEHEAMRVRLTCDSCSIQSLLD